MKKIRHIALASSLILLVVLVFRGETATRTIAPAQLSAAQFIAPNAQTDAASAPATWLPDQIPQRSLYYPSVGTVVLYGNLTKPASVVLFLSGDGGWNLGVVDMAKTLAQDGNTLVVGIDLIKYYQKLHKTTEKCLYPAGDLENLSEFVQHELKLPDYIKPILTGYSSGATLTYGLLCQSPAGTFKGGIGLGFCPDIQIKKPLCEGSGKLSMTLRKDKKGFDFTDQPAPGAPLEVLQGEIDQDCICEKTCNFFQGTKNVTVVRLPKVGHGFAVTKNWLPQFKQSYTRILAATDRSSTDKVSTPKTRVGGVGNIGENLPLYCTEAPEDANTPMVLFLSGDGGWTGFDQQICNQLAMKHLPVVGLNCQSYFWKKKTPEQVANDLTPVIRYYLQTWNKSKLLLSGYSFGANVLPFIKNRLPDDLKNRIDKMVLLSPDPSGDFEIHIAAMMGKGGGPYDVAAEIRNLQRIHVLCVSGDKEENEIQNALAGVSHVHFEKIPGSHHYNNDAAKVASTFFTL